MKTVLVAGVFAGLMAGTAQAGVMEQACLKSGRSAVSRALCGCIQDAADLTLNGKDQRLAASFFANPHKAQEIRQSNRAAHEKFWQRYSEFGTVAEAYCQ